MRQKRGALETPVSTRLNTVFWLIVHRQKSLKAVCLREELNPECIAASWNSRLSWELQVFRKGDNPQVDTSLEAACRWKEACKKMYTTARRMKTTVTEKLHTMRMANIVRVRRKTHAVLLPMPSASEERRKSNRAQAPDLAKAGQKILYLAQAPRPTP